MKQLPFTIKLSSFGTGKTIALPNGFHPEYANESTIDRTLRIGEEMGVAIGGIEYKYPTEIHEDNIALVSKVAGKKKITAIEVAYSRLSQYCEGGFINPQARKQKEVLQLVKGAIDLAAEYSSSVIIRPDVDSFLSPALLEKNNTWDKFEDGIISSLEYAQSKNVKLMLEPVKGEEGFTPLVGNTLKSLYLAHRLLGKGIKVDYLKLILNSEIMQRNRENPSEMVYLLAKENLLGGVVLNSYRAWSQEDASSFASSLKKAQLGKSGGLLEIDIPSTPYNQAESYKIEVKQWGDLFC